ncbi:MAG: hypothetical protein AAB037_05885, partial [Chloroflexota bacterium]
MNIVAPDAISLEEAPLDESKIVRLGRAIAQDTYNGSIFRGNLPPGLNIPVGSTGVIAGVRGFDGRELVAFHVGADRESNDPTLRENHWRIQTDNNRSLFFDPNFRSDIVSILPALGGLPKRQDWWELPEGEEGGSQRFYFDVMDLVKLPDGKRLDEGLVRDRVPLAVQHGAGLLRELIRTFDPEFTKFILRESDHNGKIIEPEGFTNAGTVSVQAEDPTTEEAPVASGIWRIELKNLDTNVERSALPKGANPAAASFPGLEQGHYSLTVYDGAGNPSSGTFAV